MITIRTVVAIVVLSAVSSLGFAQEGRPALAAETAEDTRVKNVLKNALPHSLDDWQVDSESNTDGINWFHDGGEAVKYPFTHSFAIRYTRKNVSEQEREKWRKIAVDEAGIQQMLDETECEITISVNNFRHEFISKSIQQKSLAPFKLAFIGQHGARLFMGSGWRLSKAEDLDGGRRSYTIEASLVKTVPMTQIQTVQIAIKGSPTVQDFFLSHSDLKAIQALVGQNQITQQVGNGVAYTKEKPLAKPIPGTNDVEFSLDGGDFKNRLFRLKHSTQGEFGYLRNNHPNPAVTDNAVTRILVQEDDNFTTKNKTGFLDITIPFIRRQGTFKVQPGSEQASFEGGINCWDGCEYSFSAEVVTVTITRYDPVGGFIEGNFNGVVKVGYKLNQPLDNDQKVRPNAQLNGHFKVRRKEDRY